ncbi:hypothetical protein YTPLAS18_00860 [Nitrospira sp.]|nr:hypothetical protein YTPLAS18_00860 [Nitrospira sp.]
MGTIFLSSTCEISKITDWRSLTLRESDYYIIALEDYVSTDQQPSILRRQGPLPNGNGDRKHESASQ